MTSELEKFFGPKPEVEMPPVERSYFGKFPEMEELCNLFLSEMEWGHDPYTVQQVAAGGRDFILAIGNKPDLLLRALKKMKKNKMSIGSPRSCITFAREMLHSPDPDSEQNRRRYLKGWDDE